MQIEVEIIIERFFCGGGGGGGGGYVKQNVKVQFCFGCNFLLLDVIFFYRNRVKIGDFNFQCRKYRDK